MDNDEIRWLVKLINAFTEDEASRHRIIYFEQRENILIANRLVRKGILFSKKPEQPTGSGASAGRFYSLKIPIEELDILIKLTI